jgi:glycosyltransferase involved in cell wall biosynthesis
MKHRKRPDHILAAAEAVPDGSFLLAGDGLMLKDPRDRAADLDNVVLPGRIAKNRLPAIYANARGLVFPSVRKGCPNVVLESMAAGTPVIGYRAMSMPELVNHREIGLLALTNYTQALVDHVAELARRGASEMGYIRPLLRS